MGTPEQDVYNVVELAKRQGQLAKKLDPARLPRLQDAVVGLEGVAGELSFDFNEARLPMVSGRASAKATLTCQTCDLPVALELTTEFEMVLASAERAAQLPRLADVRIVDDARLALAELLEDELLLALPAQVCTDTGCKNLPELEFPIPAHELPEATAPGAVAASEQEGDNPFAALRQLKGKLKKD